MPVSIAEKRIEEQIKVLEEAFNDVVSGRARRIFVAIRTDDGLVTISDMGDGDGLIGILALAMAQIVNGRECETLSEPVG